MPSATRSSHLINDTQAVLLEQLFNLDTHPTLEQRHLVARRANLQLDVVTAWIRDRRRAKSCRPPHIARIPRGRRSKSSSSNTRASHASSLSARPSLEQVASRSDLRPLPPPRTPSRRRNRHAVWENMASSPVAPPSSPMAREYVEFGREQRTRTLEWACARSRLAGKGAPDLFDDGDATEVEADEAVTPTSSCGSSWVSHRKLDATGEPDEDTLKAAFALCGLMHG